MVNPVVVCAGEMDGVQDENVQIEERQMEQSDESIVMDEVTITSINEAGEIVVESSSEKNQAEVEAYALSFMQESQPDNDIRLLGTCPPYGMDDKLTGYYIMFLRDGEPNGYVLISFLHVGNPIVTLAFEGLGIFEDVQNLQVYTSQNCVKYIGPDEFYVESSNNMGTYTSLYDGSTITVQKASEIYNDSLLNLYEKLQQPDASIQSGIQSGILDWELGHLDSATVYKIPNFGQGGSYWKTSDFSADDHCAPTAATNILWYWGWHATSSTSNRVRNRIYNTGSNHSMAIQIFQLAYAGMGTNIHSTGTQRKNILKGYTNYLGVQPQSGGVWNYKDLLNFTAIYNTITEQCPIQMSLYKGDDGHSVFALGRAQGTTQNHYKYIIILDGWNRYGRLVGQNYYDSIKGYKIYISV